MRCIHGLVAIAAVMLVLACSGDGLAGPNPPSNAQLIQHLDSLVATAPPDHKEQLELMIGALAQGAPVGTASVVLDGHQGTMSIIGTYGVVDSAGLPNDSLFRVFAWTGDDADTVLELDYSRLGIIGVLTNADGQSLNGAGALAAMPRVTAIGGVCPPSISGLHSERLAPPAECLFETVSASADLTLNGSSASDVVVSFPEQAITAIRTEVGFSPS